MKIDLHNHTKHSDGILSLDELAYRAKKNNVDIFALTDHDSVFGTFEVDEVERKYQIKIIKGLELSTLYKNESIHIVCLFKNNIVPKGMIDFSNYIVDARKKRAIEMINKIHDIYNLNINIDELLSDSQIITRANIQRNIAKNNNMTLKDASFYVSSKSKAYIPSTKMTVEEGIKLARENNCFIILAHPCLISTHQYVREILNYGFDGIEVRYPSSKNDEEYFLKLAKEYNLLPSAGSDCHGDSTHADIGTATLNEIEFLPIANKLGIEI